MSEHESVAPSGAWCGAESLPHVCDKVAGHADAEHACQECGETWL